MSYIIGIDLGTTNSVVAVIEGGEPTVIPSAEGGRLVVPVGPPGGYQTLWQYVREEDGLKAYNLGGVRFVPLLREAPQSAD